MNEPKRHHYVPRFYLRNFSANNSKTGKEYIYVFDKILNKSFLSSLMDVAQERNFYRIPEEVEQAAMDFIDHQPKIFTIKTQTALSLRSIEKTENNINSEKYLALQTKLKEHLKEPYFTENALANMEAKYASALDDLGYFISYRYSLSDNLKQKMAEFILLQHLRSPVVREILIRKIVENPFSYSPLLKIYNDINDTDLSNIGRQFLNNAINSRYFKKNVPHLKKLIWSFGLCTPNQQLYTSEIPLVFRNVTKEIIRGGGIGLEEAELIFPIRNDLILIIHNTKERKRKVKDWMFNLTDKQVEEYNTLQVMNTSRQVFCSEDNFDLAREILRSSKIE